MKGAASAEDGRARRRIAAAFIVLGIMAMAGAGILVDRALIRIPRLNQQAAAAREVQFYASSIARHINYILAETTERSFPNAAALERRFELLDAEITALVRLRRPEAVPLDRARDAAVRLARERSPGALEDLRAIRTDLDELIEEAELEAREVSMRVESSSRTTVFAAAVAGLVYVLLLAAAAIYVLGVVRRQQEAIAGYVQRLEDRNSDLEVFAGRVAHDLRGPLTPLGMSADLLQRMADEPAEVRRLASRVRRSSVRAQRLIDSLLAFSTTGRAQSEDATAQVDECVRAAIEDQQDLIDEQRIEVSTQLASVRARIDPSLLRTVLYNLIANAVRYMPREGVRRIEVRCGAKSNRVVTEVDDSGEGIPVEARATVFNSFVRSSRVPGGVGLGLATVKRIVEAHAGSVVLGDGALGGTCVRVELPLSAQAEAARPDDPDEPRPSA